jgi:hypothetical protein
LFSSLERILVEHSVLAFIMGDMLTGHVLGRLGQAAGRAMLAKQKERQHSDHPEAKSLLIPPNFHITLPKVCICQLLIRYCGM